MLRTASSPGLDEVYFLPFQKLSSQSQCHACSNKTLRAGLAVLNHCNAAQLGFLGDDFVLSGWQ